MRSNNNDNDDNNILITRFSSTNHHRIINQSSSFVSKPKSVGVPGNSNLTCVVVNLLDPVVSNNHSASLTIAAGIDPSVLFASSKMCFAISAFPSPTAANTFRFAIFTTGIENVMRSGGGFGESAMGKIHRASFTFTSE